MNSDNSGVSTTVPGLYDKTLVLLRKFYADVRKNAVVFFSSIIIVTAVFLIYNVRKSANYSASFTIVYDELVRKVYGDRLDKLNNLLQNNKSKAQSLLQIGQPALASLNEISASNILGDDLTTDINTDKVPFVVTININDTSYLKEIQDGIINYLENGNAYLIERRRLKRAEIESELEFITHQLAMMDTFKNKYSAAPVKSEKDNSAGDVGSSGGGSVFQFSYELYKKKQELLKKKEMPLNLYVIDDAIVPVRNNKSYALVTLAGIFGGIMVYICIAYFVLPVVRYKED